MGRFAISTGLAGDVMAALDTVNRLQQVMGQGGEQVFDVVPAVLRKVLKDRLWIDRVDRDGNPFPSFDAFVTHQLWQGLESNVGDLMLYCRKAPDVQQMIRAEVGEAKPHGGARSNQACGTSLKHGTAT